MILSYNCTNGYKENEIDFMQKKISHYQVSSLSFRDGVY